MRQRAMLGNMARFFANQRLHKYGHFEDNNKYIRKYTIFRDIFRIFASENN